MALVKGAFQKLAGIDALCFAMVFGVTLFYLGLLLSNFEKGVALNDEGYYLLSAKYWNVSDARVSFFGVILAPFFKILNEDVYLFRIFGLSLISLSSIFFSRQLLYFPCFSERSGFFKSTLCMSLTCASLSYYTISWTLYTPSYNLLNLSFLLIAIGTLLYMRLKYSTCALIKQIKYDLLLALVMGFIFINKATTYFVMLCLIFVALWGVNRKQAILSVILSLISALCCIATLYFFEIDFLFEAKKSFTFASYLRPGNNLLDSLEIGILGLLNGFSGDAIALTTATCVLSLLVSRFVSRCRWLAAIVVLLFIYIFLRPLSLPAPLVFYYNFIGVLLIWFFFGLLNSSKQSDKPEPSYSQPLFICLVAPLAYAIGTGNDLAYISLAAQVFFSAAFILGLAIASIRHHIVDLTLSTSMIFVALLPMKGLIEPLQNKDATYGYFSPLSSFNIEVDYGGGVILFDGQFSEGLSEFRKFLEKSGFVRGTKILDMTGRFPGLTFFSGGMPVGGKIWIQSAFSESNPGAATATRHLLEFMPEGELNGAWVIAFEDPGAGHSWLNVFNDYLPKSKYAKVGTFYVPYYAAEGKPTALQLWSPK